MSFSTLNAVAKQRALFSKLCRQSFHSQPFLVKYIQLLKYKKEVPPLACGAGVRTFSRVHLVNWKCGFHRAGNLLPIAQLLLQIGGQRVKHEVTCAARTVTSR